MQSTLKFQKKEQEGEKDVFCVEKKKGGKKIEESEAERDVLLGVPPEYP